MRNLFQIIAWEYGKESLAIFRKWENLNMKICNYQNHRRFSLRCLGSGITPVSLKLKNTIRTHRIDCTIHKVEWSLLNKRVRNVNNTLDWLEHDRYMYELRLSAILNQDLMKECKECIEDLKEARHVKVMECQKKQYERLWHEKYHSSIVAKLAQVATQTRTQFQQSNFHLHSRMVLIFLLLQRPPIPRIYYSDWDSMPEPTTNRSRRTKS